MEFELAQGRSGREAAHAYNFYGGSSDHEEEEEDPAVDEECSSSGKQHPSSSSAAAAAAAVEREHMFDKVVTPSDVGKLNRLVIPKQHAEKYFPLDAAANEKGLLLSFEDRTGKPWRFRYSYWNSSQSYVMTKGWSRFVKEKRLDAGDTVSFGRAVGDRNTAASSARLFIDWKRRPDNYHRQQQQQQPPRLPMLSFSRSPLPPWGSPAATAAARILLPSPHPVSAAYDQHRGQGYGGYSLYNAGGATVSPGASGAGGHYFLLSSSAAPVVQEVVRVPASNGEGTSAAAAMPMILDSVPVSAHSPAGGAKRVRLFGVNLDCPESDRDGCLQLRLGGSPSSSSSMSKKQQDSPPWDLDM